ncbi:hypothetical protein BV22DRAFT_992342, partial [Leucogyrophana mollusca]
MVNHAKSNATKKKEARDDTNARMEEALRAYALGQTKPKVERQGLRSVVSKHRVAFKTLGRLYKGGTSISEFNATKQKLTPAEEQVLVDFLVESADRGFSLDNTGIEQEANEILKSPQGIGYESVGHNW